MGYILGALVIIAGIVVLAAAVGMAMGVQDITITFREDDKNDSD